MNLKSKKPTLLLVDVQKAFLDVDYPGFKRNNPDAELICGKVLSKWREKNLPIIHVRHSSSNIDSKLHESNPGFEFNDHVMPLDDEIVLTKNVNSAFIGTGLKSILDKSKTEIIIIVGMTTNHCISTTTRMSGNLGYDTYLISDSTACYNTKAVNGEIIDCEVIYKTSIASINKEFATVIDSNELFNLID
ncbi:cysteine hydrolase family protein [Flavobacteriaceae bacterium]|nr:cysteine hydrolase family protein [Flavobacteriaceae bacterium]